jgi:extracellular elastinolytic metalloproteinase
MDWGVRKLDPRRGKRLRHARLATVLALAALPASAVAADKVVTGDPPPRALDRGPASFDVRDRAPAARPTSGARRAQRTLRRGLGRQGVIQLDRDTGTPAIVARRDGFLTRRRSDDPARIALGYLRANVAAFGLDRDDIDSLRVKRRATTRRGLTRIEWEQVHHGIPAFDNVIRANVSRGRLVNVSGAPEPDLSVPSTKPRLTAPDAVEAALRSVGVRRQLRALRRAREGTVLVSGGNRAKLVLFVGPDRTRLAWSTIARADEEGVYRAVVDANSGDVLKRTNLVARAQVRAFDYTPIAPSGSTPTLREAPTAGPDPWLTAFDRLRGDNTLTYSDEQDNTYIASCPPIGDCNNPSPPTAEQEIPPSSGSGSAATWDYPQVTGTPAGSNCPSTGCTWDGAPPLEAPFAPGDNWQKNREQAGTQLFYLVNNFHDHLQNDPNIDFSDAWGNFEQTASAAGAVGGDPVHAQVDDGAATALLSDDFPDANHINNASMLTLEEIPGDPLNSPEMSMFLFGDLDANVSPGDPNDVNGSDDAAIVYHEYTHGLSNRLVDPDGSGDLFLHEQGGAMGEGWSDWYAIDYLNENGFEPDAPGAVDVFYGEYENLPFSFQGLDCTVANTAACPDPPGGAGPGGFTYGDYGEIFTQPEVHADGEIWAQTLWDLRRSLIAAHGATAGIGRARALVTDGMRLTRADPDFLDMRDAILQADQVNGFGDCQRIWNVFAARGMGANASTSGPDDTDPNEGFTPGSCAGGGGGGGGTTTPPPSTGGGGVPLNPALLLPARANLSGFPDSIRVDRRGRFRIRFRGGAGQRGTAALRTVSRVRTSARNRNRRSRLLVARRTFAVPGSGGVTLTVRLSRRNLRILKLNRRFRMRATVELRNAFGSSTATRRFTLRAPRPRT